MKEDGDGEVWRGRYKTEQDEENVVLFRFEPVWQTQRLEWAEKWSPRMRGIGSNHAAA